MDQNTNDHKYTNKLIEETSPYLLQHAHNPVNWLPWGDEAFKLSEESGKPLFVSIGYSTCHWCHVMEAESFEDEGIAAYLNDHFVPVKVDREELPDVDAIYMSAVQMMNGHGGWPLHVWLTSELVPFFGGTYFPPRDGERGCTFGFETILKRVHEAYTTRKDAVVSAGEQLTRIMNQTLVPKPGTDIPAAQLIGGAAETLAGMFDPVHGGTQSAPKFPATLNIRLLLRHWKKSGDRKFLDMAVTTLEKMANGGIYDHVGGGFHRYSTDAKWLVPHFEKMLYDNALLTGTYLEGWQASGNDAFADVATGILDYVLREMTAPDGSFYSASDADSMTPSGKKEEGWFFTWTKDELKAVLDDSDFGLVEKYWSMTGTPNFEGRYIPHITTSSETIATDLGMEATELETRISGIKKRLYDERSKRELPFTDTKIITSWNGLMISAFAKAGLLLDNEAYIAASENAAESVLLNLGKEDLLYRSFKDDTAKIPAYLEDYAYLAAGLIDLYEATGKIQWFRTAVSMTDKMISLFEDKADGGFYMTSEMHDNLPAREKPALDNAMPAANAIAVLNLLRLYAFTADTKWLDIAVNAFKAFAEQMPANQVACAELLIALDFYHDASREIVIITPEGDNAAAKPFMDVLRQTYLPNRVIAITDTESLTTEDTDLIPLLAGREATENRATAYVCEQGACQLPVQEAEAFLALLKKE